MHLELSFGSSPLQLRGCGQAGSEENSLISSGQEGWFIQGFISRPSFATAEQSRGCEGINVQLKVRKLGQGAPPL